MNPVKELRQLEKLRKAQGIETGAARLWREILSMEERLHYMNECRVFKSEKEMNDFDSFTSNEKSAISLEIAKLQPWQLVFAAHVKNLKGVAA